MKKILIVLLAMVLLTMVLIGFALQAQAQSDWKVYAKSPVPEAGKLYYLKSSVKVLGDQILVEVRAEKDKESLLMILKYFPPTGWTSSMVKQPYYIIGGRVLGDRLFENLDIDKGSIPFSLIKALKKDFPKELAVFPID